MIDLTYVVAAAIVLAIAIIACIVRPYISQKLSTEQLAEMKILAKCAVEAAEMIFVGTGRGKEKKEYVVRYLQDRGFTIDIDTIDVMIESAVLELKNMLKN